MVDLINGATVEVESADAVNAVFVPPVAPEETPHSPTIAPPPSEVPEQEPSPETQPGTSQEGGQENDKPLPNQHHFRMTLFDTPDGKGVEIRLEIHGNVHKLASSLAKLSRHPDAGKIIGGAFALMSIGEIAQEIADDFNGDLKEAEGGNGE